MAEVAPGSGSSGWGYPMAQVMGPGQPVAPMGRRTAPGGRGGAPGAGRRPEVPGTHVSH